MDALGSDYSVAIVGCGPTGLTLANLLGTYGVRTLAVERNTDTVDGPRAVSIDDEALRTMQSAGVVDQVLQHVVLGYGSRYYSPGGICFMKVEPTVMPYGYPKRNAFRQPVLERQLRNALGRFPCISPVFGCALEECRASGSKVTLTLKRPDDRIHEITCDYLIGCDGAASTVRERLGIGLEGTTLSERWLIIDLENHDNTTKHTRVFCDARRPCITLPGPDRTRRFEFKLAPSEKDEDLLLPEVLEALLSSHGADPNASICRKVVYRFHARVARRWSARRVYLAGDAAHLSPPFAGQGMNSGVRDAHNLAWKLAAVIQGRIGPALLNSYETERREHVWQMIRLALRMGHVMAPRSSWSGLLTQLGFRALSTWPSARDYIAQMKYRPPARFKAGFMLPERWSAHQTLVGRLFPQPWVKKEDGGTVLFDDVVGSQFCLVARTTNPSQFFSHLAQPIWDSLGAIRVAVSPAGGVGSDNPLGIVTLTETDDSLASALARYADSALLLRPDHYVMACVPLDQAANIAEAVEALVKKTWDDDQ
jgi:3-(3-hydroxy-phenyl)propionate hydroxylase